MDHYLWSIAKTGLVLLLFFTLKYLLKRITKKVGAKFKYQPERIEITNKIVSLLLLIVLLVALTIIWGLRQSQLLVFLTTVLTILGVAFFAQWSIISNITATVIIYFNHPVRIGDKLSLLDNEYNVEGKLVDIGMFFVTIHTTENEEITMPSNVFMQKMVRTPRH